MDLKNLFTIIPLPIIICRFIQDMVIIGIRIDKYDPAATPCCARTSRSCTRTHYDPPTHTTFYCFATSLIERCDKVTAIDSSAIIEDKPSKSRYAPCHYNGGNRYDDKQFG